MIIIWNNKFQCVQETQDSWCGSWLTVPVGGGAYMYQLSIICVFQPLLTNVPSPPPTDQDPAAAHSSN